MYVARVEQVDGEMLAGSKRGELLERCLREDRGKRSLNHPPPLHPRRRAGLPFLLYRIGNRSPERSVLLAQVTQPGVMADPHYSALHFIGGAVVLVDRFGPERFRH